MPTTYTTMFGKKLDLQICISLTGKILKLMPTFRQPILVGFVGQTISCKQNKNDN